MYSTATNLEKTGYIREHIIFKQIFKRADFSSEAQFEPFFNVNLWLQLSKIL
jgi:hypothetical protein